MNQPSRQRIALLTGGDDRPYALGMASALTGQGHPVDFIASDALIDPLLDSMQGLTFLNLRGSQDESAPLLTKVTRILRYYLRLIRYALFSRARIFHILWNNKFEHFDRTLLCLLYRAAGRRIVLTAHNVNARKRDGCDSALNRLTLRIQYHLCDHILVHTGLMKAGMVAEFGVPPEKVTVIPFGINDTNPSTSLTRPEARQQLGLPKGAPVLLAFGQIAPYKGLEYLVEALRTVRDAGTPAILVIAGKVKRGCEEYWRNVSRQIEAAGLSSAVHLHVKFIPDSDVERYFKAADALVLSYTSIFQSGLPFLSYRFGLPIIATDVGAFREIIREGETGFLCPPSDAQALANAIFSHFNSKLYHQREVHAEAITRWVHEQNSWSRIGGILSGIYENLAGSPARHPAGLPHPPAGTTA